MSLPLQIALFTASIAIVVFVIVFIVALSAARKELAQAAKSLAEMKADMKLLVVDTRAMLQGVTTVSQRVDQQMNDTEQILKTVRSWTERLDKVVKEAGETVESPFTALAKKINVMREGFSAFIEALFHREKPE